MTLGVATCCQPRTAAIITTKEDVLDLLYSGDFHEQDWDLMIAHPPCTHLAVSGARWFKEKAEEQANALRFVRKLLDCSTPRIALENPISVISSRIRKPDQIIQPWQFGHGEVKATCLWLKNLPIEVATAIADVCEQRAEAATPSDESVLCANGWFGMSGVSPTPALVDMLATEILRLSRVNKQP